MAEHPADFDCCSGLTEVRTQVDEIIKWRREYEEKQARTTERLFDKLETINENLSKRWPQSATNLILVLVAIVGALTGAIATWMLTR